MESLSTKLQSQKLDQKAKNYGLSVEELMENAGKQSAKWILKKFRSFESFSVFCGPGHNGGDGWVTACHLKKAGKKVSVYACKSSSPLGNKKKSQAQSLHIKPKKLRDWKEAKKQVLIDALFGVGLDRPLKGEFKDLILKINQSSQTVVSLDLPSGLCADTGKILGSAVKAHYSLSFARAKAGSYLGEGVQQSGGIIVLTIGFPKELLKKVCDSVYLLQKQDVQTYLPSYKNTANKTDRGWALISAGKEGMWGCGLLASQAAYRVGSGFVTWASQEYPYHKHLEIPETLLARLSDKDLFDKKTAIGAGPGLGFSKEISKFLLQLKKQKSPVLLDADALTLLSRKKSFKLNKHFLLTPHSGELERLLKVPARKIDQNRLLYAQKGAQKYNSYLLLKGLYPVLSDGKKCWIIRTGNSALGKAGTGDVLTGIITGLLAQGLSVFKAGVLGNILQGETAERWIKKGKDINSFSASDIINELPFVMKELRSKS